MSGEATLSVLARSLDQLGDLLGHVSAVQLDARTPCADWTLGDLADHIVAAPGKFTVMARGEQPDWSAAPQHFEKGWAPAFRSAADDLMQVVGQKDAGSMDPAWMTAEFAVHTWDLAHALGRSTSDLDPEVAGHGLEFMRANLRAEMRGETFGPEQPAPEGGDAYDAIAAFAGRTVSA
ncbi:maleylpyruvate isomerase family mycothiol-dependent enzyme [Marmoricola sp. URHB0036]|uniref:maleylpyruvate isomerase family mycothiol-dependent enzyme n=1 Tax=Marmoricola sp. URHB0036 TaxID=1298863 RepID=UPI000425484E|nr:maleylpyruvate isomerase family mycothiol-dependent enzyme [Marmoricola sp. URHB0036]